MHHNNLKCREIVDDFCYIPKSFCSMEEDFFLGGGLNFGLLFRIWAIMKSYGHNITRNGSYDPKAPDNMYHF